MWTQADKTEDNTIMIKIWLGDLGAYNEGNLRGEWLELPMDADMLSEKIRQYSRNGEGDYFIADYEVPDWLRKRAVSEHSSPIELNDLAEQLEGLSEHDQMRVGYLIDDGASVTDALDGYEDVDFYPDMTLKQLAEHFVDEGLFGEIAPSIINYIDYEAIGRDLGIDGYDETPQGIFRRG